MSDIWGSGCSMFQHHLRVAVVHARGQKNIIIKANPKAYRAYKRHYALHTSRKIKRFFNFYCSNYCVIDLHIPSRKNFFGRSCRNKLAGIERRVLRGGRSLMGGQKGEEAACCSASPTFYSQLVGGREQGQLYLVALVTE